MPRIPLSWLGDHVELPADITAESLAADLVRVGLEEEEIHPAQVTGPLVVGEVVSRIPEPQKNGKTINWCQVDVGPEHGVDGGPRGIVCGAQNFDVGDRVVVALPGAVLPGPFAIASRKTYGHISDGMICSARELGLGEDHDGIIVLSRIGIDATPGTDARELLGLGEEVLEINVTPDRGYCFSMRGVAREYGHATGATFTDPGLLPVETLPAVGGFPVVLNDEAPIHGVAGADRFVARVVRGVAANQPSPTWMQRRLTEAGMRPISLAVDVTNYVMLDLGQPLHAYDLATLDGPITVRRARAGERLTTLDGQDRALDAEDLLITDAARVLGLAGVMGGADSEVSETTTDLLIEGAHFDPVSIARTARRHKLSSEAAKRFERGVDPQLAPVAVDRVVTLLVEHGGGAAESIRTDVNEVAPAPVLHLPLALPGRLIGLDLDAATVTGILRRIGCTVGEVAGTGAEASVAVTVPSWRPDLTEPVDLVEEVARLHGYDLIPSIVPTAPAGAGLTTDQLRRRAVSAVLADRGWVETLSYPFIGTGQLDALGVPVGDERRTLLRLANPLSEELPYLRTSLLVTLLDTAKRNVARGSSATDSLALFEVGAVTLPEHGMSSAPVPALGERPTPEVLEALHAAVPAQPRRVAGVALGQREPDGWWGPARAVDPTDAVEAVQDVARVIGVELSLVADAERAPFHPGRCVRVETAAGAVVGWAGELHPKVAGNLGLPGRPVAFELDLDLLLAAAPTAPVTAQEVSTYPAAKEDVALVVDSSVPAAQVLAAVRAGARNAPAGDVLENVRLFDVFEGAQVGEGKRSLAFALRLRADDRTLTAEETAGVREAVVAEAAARFGATLRS